MSNPDVVIMTANKNLGLVILGREWYVKEGNRQLSDEVVYKQVGSEPLDELYSRLEHICLKYSNFLSKDEIKFIILHKPSKGYRVCTL